MLKTMQEASRKIVERDLEKIEHEINVTLPRDYKDFLLKSNGGKPVPDCFPIEGFSGNPFGGIRLFFGVDRDIETSNLDWQYRVMQGRLPAGFLPIASDGSGDILCLALSGDNQGKVYFWDFYNESNPPAFDNLYFVANSLGELLSGLFEFPESV